MTDTTAKLVSLKILLDWKSRRIWSVRKRLSDNTSEYRWFKSEDRARDYASRLLDAVVEECLTPTAFHFEDDLLDMRQQIAVALDGRRQAMAELSYTHESARG
jgi:hypothetical protein